MSAIFPNGSVFSIGTTFATAITISGITNANPAVATATAHGLADGDIVMISSGWSRLDNAVCRVAGSDVNTFQLEGIDTSDTQQYPAGAGVGSAREITAFTAISQVTDSQAYGGDQQFFQWVYLEDGLQRQRPTFKNARSLQLTLDYDPDLAWHAALLTADRNGEPHAMRMALPNGSFIYYSMYVSFDGEPTATANQNMQVVANFAFANPRSVRYAS